MKVLLDTCVAATARDTLVENAHDVIWGGDWDEDPGDEEILKRACSDGRVLITLDKDFGVLAVVQSLPYSGGGTMHGHPVDADALLQHGEFVRALARKLVFDDDGRPQEDPARAAGRVRDPRPGRGRPAPGGSLRP